MKRWFLLLFGALLFMSAAPGCSGEEPLDEGQAAGHERRFGLVHVTYDHDWADASDASLLTTTAQFVRYRAMDHAEVSRLLDLPLDPERDLPEQDTCRTYDLSLDVAADTAMDDQDLASMELLEAGDLVVQTQERTLTLRPRHFPGLLPYISGVIYGEAQADLVQRSPEVVATSAGGEAVGPFSSGVETPLLPRLLQVAGDGPSANVTVAQGRDVALRWRPGAGRPDDVTFLELRYARDRRDQVLRCRLRDDGAFDIPWGLLPAGVGRTVLELSRMRRRFFGAAGLERGELRVTLRDSATLRIP